jgi:hypothetical protein
MHRMITTNLIVCHPFIFRGVRIIVTINQNCWYSNLQASSKFIFKRGSRQCYFILCAQLMLTDEVLHLFMLMMRAPLRYIFKLLLLLIPLLLFLIIPRNEVLYFL